ncbi:MAG: NAD(P)/FAD-dependent oxidoreductase [Granulosicoccus sp.]
MKYDFLIIGAGISGASAGYELAPFGSTIIVEAESSGAYHSTGRSAALYTPNYGSELVCKINRLSYGFLNKPPSGFCEHPLLTPRGLLVVASEGAVNQLQPLLDTGGSEVESLNSAQTLTKAPFLKSERVAESVFERDVADMDVHSLHQGYLNGYRKRGGTLLCGSPVSALKATKDGWTVHVGDRTLEARTVVNAAGAWADRVGSMAGAQTLGLVPKRRSAILVDVTDSLDVSRCPAVGFIGAENYIKPQGDQLMVSPGDATPMDAQDVQPDDLELAMLVDWLESETQIEVKRLNHRWAGLRSFVNDDEPVVGFDPIVNDFFWLAAQGGYGIMMSSALARAATGLIVDNRLPEDFLQVNIEPAMLSVERLLASV